MDLTRVTILAFFLAQPGALPYHAQALTRAAVRESGPLANPPRTGLGHCLYQWAGARWERLRRYGDCPPLEVQLAFALAELRTPWFDCFWTAPPAAAYAVLRRTFLAGERC